MAFFDAGEPADCVEFCSATRALCGTYELREASGERVGGVQLLACDAAAAAPRRCAALRLSAAVLDLACPANAHTALAALADGGVAELAVATDALTLRRRLARANAHAATAAPALALAVEHSARFGDNGAARALASFSDGGVAVLALDDSAAATWAAPRAHSDAAWSVACGAVADGPHVLLSGGDDARWCAWDVRVRGDAPVRSRRFDAGVTTAERHRTRPHVVAVGCYDGVVRAFDVRRVRQPLAEFDAGGGVWRLKWHAAAPDHLLAACMRGGFHHLRLADDGSAFEALESWSAPHDAEQLAYGADWTVAADGQTNIVCCSFYDRRVSHRSKSI